MEQLYVLGTGNAVVTRCYNTCFALRDGEQFFLVDTGGGNQIPVSYTHLDVYKRQLWMRRESDMSCSAA